MEKGPSWEANMFSAFREIPRILWDLKFFTAFARARYLSLTWARVIQAIHLTSWIYILILSSFYAWVFQVVFSPQVFSHQHSVYTFTISLTLFVPHPSDSSCFDHWIISVEQWRSESSFLCSFHHSPVNSSLLDPNTFLSILFSNTLSLCASFNARHQVSQTNETTDKIIVLCIWIFIFLDSKLEDKRFWKRKKVRHVFRNVAQIS